MEGDHVEVTCPQGRLKGLVKKSSGPAPTTYFSFQGIPYAKPPVGPLRFKAPQPFGSWEGVRDATKEGNDTIQRHMIFNVKTGNEDCLYLNVFTSQLVEKRKRAVMVWIHGGGFTSGSGSSDLYGPDYLIEHDVVLVTINYRCGALGFLSLENGKIPGNFGLKDQTLALRWVRDNITSFGGDSNNVTIFGGSAGGASVHYHILSPTSTGLFHKAIMQSGTADCPWALQTKPREKALVLARQLGCSPQNLDDVYECLMAASAIDIVSFQDDESSLSVQEILHKFKLQFLPCVEVEGETPFLSESPQKLLKAGKFNKVPVINGVVDKEGLLALAIKNVDMEKINEDLSVLVPIDLDVVPGSAEACRLGKKIAQFYTNSDTISWDVIHQYVDFVSDIAFVLGMEKTRQSLLTHGNAVYSYQFTFNSPRTLSYFMLPAAMPDKASQLLSSGVCHGDELAHLFKSYSTQLPFIPPSKQDQAFMEKFLKAWTTFAKSGNPNSKELGNIWEADDLKNPRYFDLGQESKMINDISFSKRMSFWKEVYEKGF